MHNTQMKVHGAIVSMEPTPGREDSAQDPLTRFKSNITPDWDSGCWLWNGHCGDDGYPRFASGKTYRAHRWIWMQLVNSDLTEDVELDHVGCSIKCVRPAHLQPVTRARHHEITVERKKALTVNPGKTFFSEKAGWSVSEVLFARVNELPDGPTLALPIGSSTL